MKSNFILLSLTFLGLTFLSFKNSPTTNFKYDEVLCYENDISKEAAEFTRLEQRTFASDNTVWSFRVETWTITDPVKDLTSLNNSIEKN